MKRILNFIGVSFALVLSGCAPQINGPTDITFLSVQLVDKHDQKEFPATKAVKEKPHVPLLKVSFTSNANLQEFAMKNYYSVSNRAYFCHDPVHQYFTKRQISDTGVFLQGELLPRVRPLGKLESPIIYYLYLPVTGEGMGAPGLGNYDLGQKPKDICFYIWGIKGYEDWGVIGHAEDAFKSNVAVIPKEEIAAAFHKVSETGLR